MNFSAGNIITKGIGATALCMIGYDSHVLAKVEAAAYQKDKRSASVKDAFYNTMGQDAPSAIQTAVKKRYFRFKTDETFTDFFTATSGYVKGFCKMLVSSVIPLALATGTIVSKPGWLSKTFGLGLLGYGTVFLLNDVMGITKPRH